MKNRQAGIVVAYLLIAISLLSVVTLAYSKIARSSSLSQWNQETRSALLDQVSLIRSRLIACATSYPSGDAVNHVRYPTTPTVALVSDLTCPGNTAANNNLWSGTGGIPLPAIPPRFRPWTYSYVSGGTMIITTTAAQGISDTAAMGVLDMVAGRIGTSATRSGPQLAITLMN